MAFLDKTGLERLWVQIVSKLGGKVDKEDGKGLSTNDYTTEDKTKLDGIAESADAVSFTASATSGNKVGTITINGNATNMYAPAQASVSKLATARTIDGISFDGTSDVTRYAVCDTEAATADKVATMYDGSTFVLDVGARVTVKFTYGNTAYPPTLNVAGTGAKSIPSENSNTYGNPHARYWGANSVVDFIYNGTNWNIVGLSNVGRTESNGGEVFNDYYNNKATGERSHAEGYQTEASGSYSHAEGNETKATGMRSHAEGYQTEASGYYAHAEGCTTVASDNAAHAEGYYSKATNDYDHAEGYHTTASGGYGAHAEGYYTTASGNSGSHAEGYYAEASGGYAHAEGYQTQASNYGAHAEGGNTVASSSYAHAEGYQTTASGSDSHAEGYHTTATGDHSHAEGYETKATGNYSHVQGQYNIDDTDSKYAHIVGNGSDDASRSNAHTIDWNGVGWFAGGVKVGGTGQDDAAAKSVVTTINVTDDDAGNVTIAWG